MSGKPLLKRWWVRISLGLLVLGLVAFLARNFLVRKGLETAVTEMTGFPLEIESFNLGIADSKVVVKGMHFRNPRGFPDPRCASIRRLAADVDLKSAFGEEFHVQAIDLDIEDIVVVKNAVGETNLDRLAALGGGGDEREPAAKKEPAKERKWRCDLLHLRIPRVLFLDYTSLRDGKPKQEVYKLNVDETFHDLTEPDAIVRIIVLKVLSGTPIRLVNATVETLSNGLHDVVGGVVKGVGGVIGGTVKGVGGLIGVGGEEEPKKEPKPAPPPPPPKKPTKKK